MGPGPQGKSAAEDGLNPLPGVGDVPDGLGASGLPPIKATTNRATSAPTTNIAVETIRQRRFRKEVALEVVVLVVVNISLLSNDSDKVLGSSSFTECEETPERLVTCRPLPLFTLPAFSRAKGADWYICDGGTL